MGGLTEQERKAYDEQWRCAVCRTAYVVRYLARQCEARHESTAG